jgi:ABC-type amino acid transport substrate-binding protein
MRRLTACALFLATIVLSGTAAVACGDKLLVIGRGVRFQRLSAARQSTVVIYSAGAQRGPLGNARLQTTLKGAVHQVQVVHGGAQLDEALNSGHIDVVLVESADLAGITRQLQLAASQAAILPIFVKPSKADFAAAQKTYKFALKATADDVEYLAAIDEVMKTKVKSSGKP